MFARREMTVECTDANTGAPRDVFKGAFNATFRENRCRDFEQLFPVASRIGAHALGCRRGWLGIFWRLGNQNLLHAHGGLTTSNKVLR
jgi:hypothetical protein